MIIIVGYSLSEAVDRDAAVAAFQPMVERARREGDVSTCSGSQTGSRLKFEACVAIGSWL
jgi:hypothetical protein